MHTRSKMVHVPKSLEVMGPDASNCLNSDSIAAVRKWTKVQMPKSLGLSCSTPHRRGSMNFYINEDGNLFIWKSKKSVLRARRPGLFAKAQARSGSRSGKWLDKQLKRRARAILRHKGSPRSLSRKLRVGLKTVCFLLSSPILHEQALLLAAYDEAERIKRDEKARVKKVVYLWSVDHLKKQGHPLFIDNVAYMADNTPPADEGQAAPANEEATAAGGAANQDAGDTQDEDDDEDSSGASTATPPPPATTTVPTHVYEQLLRNNRSGLKLEYKYRKFNGKVEDEWFRFKQGLIAYMANFGLSRSKLAEHVANYRSDPSVIPVKHIRDRIREFLTAHLLDEALDMVDGESDGFRQYMILVERFEHLRLGRYLRICEKLFHGITYQNNMDSLFKQFTDLNLMLKDFGGEVDHRLLIAHILKVLPASFVTAKAHISMLTECSLEQAKTILQAHMDQQKMTEKVGSASRMALQTDNRILPASSGKAKSSAKPSKKRTPNNFPKTPGAVCEKCGYKNHTSSQCRKTMGYSCKHCGGNHLERMCKNSNASKKFSTGEIALMVTRGTAIRSNSNIVFQIHKVNLDKRKHIKEKMQLSQSLGDSEPAWFKRGYCMWENSEQKAFRLEKLRQWRARMKANSGRGKKVRKAWKKNRPRRANRPQRIQVYHAEDRRWRDPVQHSAFMVTRNEAGAPTGVLSFVVDSGATCHVIKVKGPLSNFVEADLPPIRVAKDSDAAAIRVFGFGNVRTSECTIRDLQYAPGARDNLLSVPLMTKRGWSVTFSGDTCTMVKGQTVLHGVCEDGIYRYNPNLLSDWIGDDEDVKAEESESKEIANLAVEDSQSKVKRIVHRRFAHPSTTLDIYEHTIGTDAGYHPDQCEACISGKRSRSAARKKYQGDDWRRERTVYVDFAGPFPAGLHGHRYFMVFLHFASRYVSVFPMSDKDGAELSAQIYANRHQDFDILQCDKDPKFFSSTFETLVSVNGIKLRFTSPGRHEFQGAVERVIRTLTAKARTLLADSGLDRDRFWSYAFVTAAYLYNRTPTVSQPTPYERRYGSKPDVSNIRVWGCEVRVLDPTIYPKSKPRTFDGWLIGFPHYTFSHGTYTVYTKRTGKVIHTRDLVFLEDKNDGGVDAVEKRDDTDSDTSDSSDSSDSEIDSSEAKDPPARRSSRVRKKRSIFDPSVEAKKPQLLSSKSVEGQDVAYSASNTVSEPKNWRQALQSEIWKKAMMTEWEAILSKDTVEAVVRKPVMRPIRCKWVFRWKAHELRAKARVVVLGFLQDTSNLETYAPTASYQSIRLIIHKAALENWNLEQLDVNAAFLNADAPPDTYIVPPDGLHDIGFGIGKNKTFKLKKSLYGMATSPLAWYKKFKQSLAEFGLQASRIEPCLYTIAGKLYVLVYVDDLLFTGVDSEVERFKNFISSEYKVKLQGPAKHFCGIQVLRDSKSIQLCQSDYISDLLTRFNMVDCKIAKTPMAGELLPSQSEHQDAEVAAKIPYREIVGSLMFLMTQTRPDLAFVLSSLSRHLHNFDESHWTAAKRVLRYLKGTQYFSLDMELTERETHELVCFSDSDWANSSDRKSISGVILTLDGTPFLWYSTKQSLHALSSSEAELIALCESNKKLE